MTWRPINAGTYLQRGGGLLRLRRGVHEETKLRFTGLDLVEGAQAGVKRKLEALHRNLI
jgi:hypothetical protein